MAAPARQEPVSILTPPRNWARAGETFAARARISKDRAEYSTLGRCCRLDGRPASPPATHGKRANVENRCNPEPAPVLPFFRRRLWPSRGPRPPTALSAGARWFRRSRSPTNSAPGITTTRPGTSLKTQPNICASMAKACFRSSDRPRPPARYPALISRAAKNPSSPERLGLSPQRKQGSVRMSP